MNNNTILSDSVQEEVVNTGSQETVEEVKKQLDEDEMSAIFINQAAKQFRSVAYTLANRKKRSLARVLEAVLFEPLEEVQLVGKEEKELFALCSQIMYHKGVVMRYAFSKVENKTEGEVTNEQKEQ